MSPTRPQRDRWLQILLLVAVFVLAPRSGAATSGMGGGHLGSPFALGGAGTFGSTFARGAFNGGHGQFHGSHHRFGRGRHGHDFFPYGFGGGYPYDDYAYEPECDGHPCYSDNRPPRRQHSGYCDVSGHYPQDCVWKDGP